MALISDGLDNPVVINGTLPYGRNLTTENSKTTFCGQTSTFEQTDSGEVTGYSGNTKYSCVDATNTTSYTIDDDGTKSTIKPVWSCLTDICT
jgi:hypothetical protein